MLENNTVFVAKGWSSLELRTPEMSIQLGDTLSLHNSDIELAIKIPNSVHCLDDSFALEAPEVWASYKKAVEKRDTELTRLRTELAHVKQQLADLQNSCAFEGSEEAQ
jgi:phage shock protein A